MTVYFSSTKITDYYFPAPGKRDRKVIEDGETVDDERIELNRERLIDDQNTSLPPPPKKPTYRHEKGPVLGKLFV